MSISGTQYKYFLSRSSTCDRQIFHLLLFSLLQSQAAGRYVTAWWKEKVSKDIQARSQVKNISPFCSAKWQLHIVKGQLCEGYKREHAKQLPLTKTTYTNNKDRHKHTVKYLWIILQLFYKISMSRVCALFGLQEFKSFQVDAYKLMAYVWENNWYL